MAHAKGSLDCSYCRHFGGAKGIPEGYGREAQCEFHGFTLPSCALNRICCHFQPNDTYWRDNRVFTPPGRRFAWFEFDLRPGTLYFYRYDTPAKFETCTVMRMPDQLNGTLEKLKA